MTEKRKWAVKVGSVTVWIRLQRPTRTDRHYACYTLDYHENGRRMRPSFTTLDSAKKQAKEVAERLSRGDTQSFILKGTALMEYSRALESLAPLGVSLDIAAADLANATMLLNGKGTLLDAARYYASTHGADMKPIRVGDLIVDLIRTREANHASQAHLTDLRFRLKKFADAFQCDVHSIRPAEVQDFLSGLNLSPRSANNYRTAISNLFGHARLRNHAPKDFDPLAQIPWAKGAHGEVEIYAPTELKIMIEAARIEMRPYLVIAAFGGLRQAEISRLNWKEVKDDHIVILGENAKTRTKRHVPILPNLAAWLTLYRQQSGAVCHFKNIGNELWKLCRGCSIQSKHNGLRHSFGSYRLAREKDPAKVAYEMGNTTTMVFRHYRKVVTEIESARWFGIYPNTDGKPEFMIQTQIQAAQPVATMAA